MDADCKGQASPSLMRFAVLFKALYTQQGLQKLRRGTKIGLVS